MRPRARSAGLLLIGLRLLEALVRVPVARLLALGEALVALPAVEAVRLPGPARVALPLPVVPGGRRAVLPDVPGRQDALVARRWRDDGDLALEGRLPGGVERALLDVA